MKIFLFVILGLLTDNIFSQTFLSLDGIEKSNNETILLYHFGSPDYQQYAPVYKYNVAAGSEQLIMDAYYMIPPGGELSRSVQDFEFFPNDTLNFINCGFEVHPDNHGFIALNDTVKYYGVPDFIFTDISKQNPLKTFASDGTLHRSFDGGNTYPQDSVLNFNMISVSDFNANEIFGIDYQQNLIKSFNGGHSWNIVDNIPVVDRPDYRPKFYYDLDQLHIYRINFSGYSYNLYVSDDNGNSYTWQLKYSSENPLYFSINSSQSGEVYLADRRKIYKSTDFGSSFNLFAEFPHRIVGIYKKPSSDILYAATHYDIFEVNPDTITVIKHIPVPESLYEWFPLAVGDRWVYNFEWIDEYGWVTEKYITYREIVADNVTIDGKNYFLMLYKSPYTTDSLYYRIDSLAGKIYTIKNGNEGLFYDFQCEVGDTIIFDPSDPYSSSYSISAEEDISIFGFQTKSRTLVPNWFDPSVVLVDTIGFYHSEFFEFGGFSETLKGFIKKWCCLWRYLFDSC